MSVYEKKYHRISLGHRNNALVMLIAICMIIFITLAFIKAMFYLRYKVTPLVELHFAQDILSWFALPADFKTFISRPWTLFTFPFSHSSLMQLIGNMLWLWGFGFLMQDLTGNRKLFPVFFYGTLFGAIAFLSSYAIFPALAGTRDSAFFAGASSGVIAVAIAVTTIQPGFRIFPLIKGGIPLWILTVVFILINFVSVPINDTAAHIANLAGGISGFLFIFFLRKGYDGSDWINNFFDWVTNLFNPDKPVKGKSIQEELYYIGGSEPFKRTPNVTQKRIDDILDKISQQGYQQLTEEEKELLKRARYEDL